MPQDLPIRIFRPLGTEPYGFLIKFRVYLEDKPGSLADFSSLIGNSGCNINYFHYNRGLDPCRVAVEVQAPDENVLEKLTDSLRGEDYSFDESSCEKDEVEVTLIENVMEIKVLLQNMPGTLAAFARLLSDRGANVTYMLYDENIDPESADVALAAKNPDEIDVILKDMNDGAYQYRVIYRGSDKETVGHIIGLKLVEKFFIRLKKLLSGSDLEEVRSLVESSKDLYADLLHFYSEAGRALQAGDVYEKVLALASMSRSRTGRRFSCEEMPIIEAGGGVKLHSFRLPTSENIFVFSQENELTLIDTGYGIYYEDLKKFMKEKGLDPSRIKRILITHADADHAGAAGRFSEDFGARVFMHPAGGKVIESGNRADGMGSGKLSNLNKFYTRLVNRFTECRFPQRPDYFPSAPIGRAGGFDVIDSVRIGELTLEVLEGKGGHILGCVFFLERRKGLLFTSDYLINTRELSSEDREHLGVYRYLLTDPNRDSDLYRRESSALMDLAKEVASGLRPLGRQLIILPGHGKYYTVGFDPLTDQTPREFDN